MEQKQLTNGIVILDDIMRDSFSEDLLSINSDNKFKLIIADPPYGDITTEKWDNWTSNDYLKLSIICENLLEDGGSAYIWGGIGKPKNRVLFKFLSEVEDKTDLTIKNYITWKKKKAYGKKDDYLFTREELIWLVKGSNPSIFNIPLLDEKRGYSGWNAKYPAKSEYKRRSNVWTDITEIMKNKKHSCEKPERLAEVMIETHTNIGDVVLDLFAGSGNVSIVANRLGRKYIAVEKFDKEYNEIIGRL